MFTHVDAGGIIETHKRMHDAGDYWIMDRRSENRALPWVFAPKTKPFEYITHDGRTHYMSVSEAKRGLESYLDTLDTIDRG